MDIKEFKKIDLEKIVRSSIELKKSLIEKGFKEDDIAFFMTIDIQRELSSFVSKAVNFEIKQSEKFVGCPLHLIQGEVTMYIGIKI